MIWLWLFLSLLFVSPAQAQCDGIFSPNTICGNNGGPSTPLTGPNGGYFQGSGVSVPPHLQTFGSYGVGVQLNVQDQTSITSCANVPSNAVSDSAPAIQCMIHWMNQITGGGSLYFPCGVYKTNSTIVWGPQIAVRGQQRDCVVIEPTTDFVAINVPDTATYTVSSGTYNNSTGVLSFTMTTSAPSTFLPQTGISLSGLTGTGNFNLFNGFNNLTVLTVSGTNITVQGPVGEGASTFTGGSLSTGGIDALFEDISITGTCGPINAGCAPATDLVYVGDNNVVDMNRVRLLGGLYALENNGVDAVLVDLAVCGWSTVGVGGCVKEAGGNWYFHASMDNNSGVIIGSAWTLVHKSTVIAFERSCVTCDFSVTGASGSSILINDTASHVWVSGATLSNGLSTNGQWTGVTNSELAGTLANTGTGSLEITNSWYNVGSGTGVVTGITNCSTNDGLICGLPTASSCAGFAVTGDDRAGTITMNSTTSCTINFGHTWRASPVCTVAPGSATSGVHLGISTTQLAVTFGTANTGFYYQCSGL